MAALRADGLVITEQGRGTYTRPQHSIRRLGPDRYSPGAEHAQPAMPATNGDPAEQVDAAYQEVAATADLARLFQVQLGTMLLERRLLHRVHGIPQHLTTSYYLLDMVAGTPVADPNREPWPGGHIAQLASLGVAVTKITETVRSRMPTTDEADALRAVPAVPLLAVTRCTKSGTRTVEVANEILTPADRSEYEYEIPINGRS